MDSRLRECRNFSRNLEAKILPMSPKVPIAILVRSGRTHRVLLPSFLHSQFHFRIFFSRGKRRDLRSPVQRLVGYGGNLVDVLSPSKSIVLGSVVPRSGRGGEFPQPKTRLFEKLRTFQIGSDRPCSFLLWRSI